MNAITAPPVVKPSRAFEALKEELALYAQAGWSVKSIHDPYGLYSLDLLQKSVASLEKAGDGIVVLYWSPGQWFMHFSGYPTQKAVMP